MSSVPLPGPAEVSAGHWECGEDSKLDTSPQGGCVCLCVCANEVYAIVVCTVPICSKSGTNIPASLASSSDFIVFFYTVIQSLTYIAHLSFHSLNALYSLKLFPVFYQAVAPLN